MMHIDYQYLEERTQKRSKRMGNLWGALLLVGFLSSATALVNASEEVCETGCEESCVEYWGDWGD